MSNCFHLEFGNGKQYTLHGCCDQAQTTEVLQSDVFRAVTHSKCCMAAANRLQMGGSYSSCVHSGHPLGANGQGAFSHVVIACTAWAENAYKQKIAFGPYVQDAVPSFIHSFHTHSRQAQQAQLGTYSYAVSPEKLLAGKLASRDRRVDGQADGHKTDQDVKADCKDHRVSLTAARQDIVQQGAELSPRLSPQWVHLLLSLHKLELWGFNLWRPQSFNLCKLANRCSSCVGTDDNPADVPLCAGVFWQPRPLSKELKSLLPPNAWCMALFWI